MEKRVGKYQNFRSCDSDVARILLHEDYRALHVPADFSGGAHLAGRHRALVHITAVNPSRLSRSRPVDCAGRPRSLVYVHI